MCIKSKSATKIHKLTVFLIRHQWCIYQATVHTISLYVLYQIDFLKKFTKYSTFKATKGNTLPEKVTFFQISGKEEKDLNSLTKFDEYFL